MTQNNPLRNAVLIAASFALLLWGLKLYELVLGVNLYQLGVYPRAQSGLLGIVTAPLIHGSWQHVIGNTLPIVLLGSMLIYGYPKSRFWAISGIWLLSGAGVWLFARQSYHFGASGLAHGMFFYLFVGGILRRDKRSAALLMLAFYLYGGMLLTILPRDPTVSFESHLFGAMAGAVCAYAFRNWDPKPSRQRYHWERQPNEDESIEEEDPIIGDQWRSPRNE
jgi:membrane associated rhomboid family serine protease